MSETDKFRDDLFDAFRDALFDALFDAYAGGSSGRGWTFIGEPVSKEEMRASIPQSPDQMRHLNHMATAVWAVVERWTDLAPDELASGEPEGEGNER